MKLSGYLLGTYELTSILSWLCHLGVGFKNSDFCSISASSACAHPSIQNDCINKQFIFYPAYCTVCAVLYFGDISTAWKAILLGRLTACQRSATTPHQFNTAMQILFTHMSSIYITTAIRIHFLFIYRWTSIAHAYFSSIVALICIFTLDYEWWVIVVDNKCFWCNSFPL